MDGETFFLSIDDLLVLHVMCQRYGPYSIPPILILQHVTIMLLDAYYVLFWLVIAANEAFLGWFGNTCWKCRRPRDR